MENKPNEPNEKKSALETCEACGKLFVPQLWLPEGSDKLCDECRKTYMDCAKIYCLVCNKIVGRVEPKVTENGFYVKPRAILHVRHCPDCDPLAGSAEIVEIEEYLQKLNRGKPWDGKND